MRIYVTEHACLSWGSLRYVWKHSINTDISLPPHQSQIFIQKHNGTQLFEVLFGQVLLAWYRSGHYVHLCYTKWAQPSIFAVNQLYCTCTRNSAVRSRFTAISVVQSAVKKLNPANAWDIKFFQYGVNFGIHLVLGKENVQVQIIYTRTFTFIIPWMVFQNLQFK